VGFEPTIAVLEGAKTVRDLDRSATGVGRSGHAKNTAVDRKEQASSPGIATINVSCSRGLNTARTIHAEWRDFWRVGAEACSS
jgi:hypothetical protein